MSHDERKIRWMREIISEKKKQISWEGNQSSKVSA